jgi:hypothetical protein
MEVSRVVTNTTEVEIPETLEVFLNWEFSSGGTTGPDIKIFARQFRKFVKNNISADAKLIFNTEHYCVYGFLKRNGKSVSFSISKTLDLFLINGTMIFLFKKPNLQQTIIVPQTGKLRQKNSEKI